MIRAPRIWRLVVLGVAGAALAGIAWFTISPWIARGSPGALTWPHAGPEPRGVDRERLASLGDDLRARGTAAFLVLHRGRILHEQYAWGRGPWRPQRAASLTKSVLGCLATLVAADRGWLELDEPVARYLEEWRGDSLRSRITFRHILSHRSGVPHGRRSSEVEDWAMPFWAFDPSASRAMLTNMQAASPPGSSKIYSGPAYGALSFALASALRGQESQDASLVIRRYIQEPLEIPAAAWPVESGGVFESHAGRVVPLWSGTSLTARAAARVGEMMRDLGTWQSRTVLDSSLVLQAVTPAVSYGEPSAAPVAPEIPRTGLGWWLNRNGALPELPQDAFLGVGDGGQLLLVVPSMDLIVVRFGSGIRGISMRAPFWRTLRSEIVGPLMECFEDPETEAGSRGDTPSS